MQHVSEVRRRDLRLAARPCLGDAEPDAVAERYGRKRRHRLRLPLLQGLRDQQRLVVEDRPGAPPLPQNGPDIDGLRAQHRRPDELRLGRADQPLAAEGDEQHLVLADAGPRDQPLEPGRHSPHEGLCPVLAAFLRKPVEQRAGIVHQRVLDGIGRDDDDDQVAAVAALAEQHARPPAAGRRLLFVLAYDRMALEVGGDRGHGRRGQPCRLRKLRVRQRPMAPQRRQNERAVLLPDQLRARLGQHCLPVPPVSLSFIVQLRRMLKQPD